MTKTDIEKKVDEWKKNPAMFIRDIWGIKVDEHQEEALKKVAKSPDLQKKLLQRVNQGWSHGFTEALKDLSGTTPDKHQEKSLEKMAKIVSEIHNSCLDKKNKIE